MSDISTCPKCQRPVSIPAGVDLAALVRCPLCNQEYPMGEALPPVLVPVADAHSSWAADIVRGSATAIEVKKNVEQQDEAQQQMAGELKTAEALHRRKRPPKPWWQTPIEIVTGGLAGCLVAYYALAIWLGPELKRQGFPILTVLPGIVWLTTEAEPKQPLPHADKAP